MRTARSLLLSLAFVFYPALGDEHEQKVVGPWRTYKSRPDIRSLYMDIKTNAGPDALVPGYYFLTPYISDFQRGSFGPQIYDSSGNLIWYGNETVHTRAMDAHVCDYLGGTGDHICYNDAAPVEQGGHSSGTIRFLDNTYSEVAIEYNEEGDLRAPDIHELNVPLHTDGNILLQDVYQPRSADLSSFNGSRDGWVLDACFQEINLRTKAINFEWCAMDHVELDETYVYLWAVQWQNFTMAVSGNGTSLEPWDFFHINSISKNEENDYIISARHFNSLMKIAGNDNTLGKRPGEIVWRFGGKKNDFEFTGFEMSRQHAARFLKTTESETVLSVFDNGSDGVVSTNEFSYGRILSLNNQTMVAQQIHTYPSPEQEHSYSQGSMQVLESGNVVIGWGEKPFFTEFAENGTVLFHAEYLGGVESFRTWKFPWTGHPVTKPDLLAYSLDVNSSALYAYVSWNGATEVKSWRFYLSYNGANGPWHSAGTFVKDGFETFVDFSKKSRWGTVKFAPVLLVEALDSEGMVLGTSQPVKTFAPNAEIIEVCNETMCNIDDFTYSDEFSSASEYKSSNVAGWVSLAIFMLALELFVLLMAIYGWDIIVKVKGAKINWTRIRSDDSEKEREKRHGRHRRGASSSVKFSLNPLTLGDQLVKTYWRDKRAEKKYSHAYSSSLTHRRNTSLALELGHDETAPLNYDMFLEVAAQRKVAASPMPEMDGPETGPGGISYVATSRD